MLFIAILFISLFSIIYIFYNFSNKNFLNITNFKPKSKKFLLYLNILFLFLLSSLIYYKIGNPFINMDVLYSSKEKLINKIAINNIIYSLLFLVRFYDFKN